MFDEARWRFIPSEFSLFDMSILFAEAMLLQLQTVFLQNITHTPGPEADRETTASPRFNGYELHTYTLTCLGVWENPR